MKQAWKNAAAGRVLPHSLALKCSTTSTSTTYFSSFREIFHVRSGMFIRKNKTKKHLFFIAAERIS